MQGSFCNQYFPSNAHVNLIRGSATNTEMITYFLNSEIPANVPFSVRLKVENKVLILALLNFNGLLLKILTI